MALKDPNIRMSTNLQMATNTQDLNICSHSHICNNSYIGILRLLSSFVRRDDLLHEKLNACTRRIVCHNRKIYIFEIAVRTGKRNHRDTAVLCFLNSDFLLTWVNNEESCRFFFHEHQPAEESVEVGDFPVDEQSLLFSIFCQFSFLTLNRQSLEFLDTSANFSEVSKSAPDPSSSHMRQAECKSSLSNGLL